MFGYVFPDKPELKIREFAEYRAVYCSLCRELRSFGFGAKAFLSYDFVFAAMLDMAANGADTSIASERCNTNPLEKVGTIPANSALRRAAAALIISSRYKLLDTCADEAFVKRIAARAVMAATGKAYRRAKAELPAFDDMVRRMTDEQSRYEAENGDSLDRTSDPTARSLSFLFASMSEEPTIRPVLERLGYLVGRFVYLADAGDDLTDDLKRGRYNPLARRFILTKDSAPAAMEDARAEIRAQLRLTEAQIEACYRLFRPRCWGPILDNIVYLGFKKTADGVGKPKQKGTDKNDQSL